MILLLGDIVGEKYAVVATAIVVKEGKYLIAQRSKDEEKFPSKWTVPGGNLDPEDYVGVEKNAGGVQYEILEIALKREVLEEVGLEIGEIKYVTSMVYQKSSGPAICLSFFADWKAGDVKLSEELTDFAWVSADEAKNYDMIPGIS